MIDQMNSKITILTGEIKLLESDKETGKHRFQFHCFIKSPNRNNAVFRFPKFWGIYILDNVKKITPSFQTQHYFCSGTLSCFHVP